MLDRLPLDWVKMILKWCNGPTICSLACTCKKFAIIKIYWKLERPDNEIVTTWFTAKRIRMETWNPCVQSITTFIPNATFKVRITDRGKWIAIGASEKKKSDDSKPLPCGENKSFFDIGYYSDDHLHWIECASINYKLKVPQLLSGDIITINIDFEPRTITFTCTNNIYIVPLPFIPVLYPTISLGKGAEIEILNPIL